MNSEFTLFVRDYFEKFKGDLPSSSSNFVIQTKFTADGPGSYPESGNILDYPDALWSEDKLTDQRISEAIHRIELQGSAISEHWRKSYTEKSGKYWHEFYKRNQNNFYKDRHYLHIVFPELLRSVSFGEPESEHLRLLEVGCGVGNAILPLLILNPNLSIVAVDLAPSAIKILTDHCNASHISRISPHVCDVSKEPLPLSYFGVEGSEGQVLDLVLCMFVLSAMDLNAQNATIARLSHSMKVGGKLLLRDYGRYDEAQLRFKKGSKLGDNFYVRQDGTCSYFFSTEELISLCARHGLQVEECEYITRQYANRQQQQARRRVWIHGKFVKTSLSNNEIETK